MRGVGRDKKEVRRAGPWAQRVQNADFKTMEDDLDPPYQKNPDWFGCLILVSVFWGPKTPPNCPDRTFLSIQSQANPFFTDPSPFPPNLNFFEFPRFLSKPPAPQIFGFSGSGVSPKNNYSQNQPSGGSFFSKKTPPLILRPSRVWIFQKSSQKRPKSSSLILKSCLLYTSPSPRDRG